MNSQSGLLVVDVQNDFCPGGSLAVPDGDTVIAVLNQYIQIFSGQKLSIFASRDWHPQETKHFQDFGGPWPAHCVQETNGAKFHPDLKLPPQTLILSKGMDPNKDSYSAFQAVNDAGEEFAQILKNLKIEELYVGGLATDYCVKASVIDGIKYGFEVYLLMDAVKGVDISPHDCKKAIEAMTAVGVKKITLQELKGK